MLCMIENRVGESSSSLIELKMSLILNWVHIFYKFRYSKNCFYFSNLIYKQDKVKTQIFG